VSQILRSLRLLSDPVRVRLLLLLESEELSVAELQTILAKGQSQISTHLSQLKRVGLVEDRRTGKNIFYRLKLPGDEGEASAVAELLELLRIAARELPGISEDRDALALVLAKRRDRMRRAWPKPC
jgi:DNA-binding transcriptional ArsR family regulator